VSLADDFSELLIAFLSGKVKNCNSNNSNNNNNSFNINYNKNFYNFDHFVTVIIIV
jgi:hypothetical protein